MSNKQEELQICDQSQGHDLITVTETWRKRSHDWNVVRDGSVLFRRDRPGGKVVMVFVCVSNWNVLSFAWGEDEEHVESL